jgi:hypothetical protein
MKNRSFLFLIAALAMGLALFGCSTDSDDGGTTTITDYRGYASQVDAIHAAFEKAPDVYLTGPVEVRGDEMLLVKSGNRLHLDSFTITVIDGGGIAIEDDSGITWENGSVTGKADNAAYLIGPDGAFDGKPVTKVGTIAITPDGAENVAYTNVNDRAIGATTLSNIVFNASGEAKASGGTLTVLLSELTVPDTHYSNAGSLAVTGDVTLAGTLAGLGGFDVYGKLTSNVADAADGPTLVAGTLTARTIKTNGGNFGGPVIIKSPTVKSEFGGTQTTVTGYFDTVGPVDFTGATFTDLADIGGAATFAKPVTFEGAATLLSNAEFSDDVTFTALSKIIGNATFGNDKTVSGKVTVTGQLVPSELSATTLLLAPGGEIIYTGGVKGSFLNTAGTLAALSQEELGTIAITISSAELKLSGAGSFVIGSQPIRLTSDGHLIQVDGTTGVYFSTAEGIIEAEAYTLGGKAGTLSDSNGAVVGGFILTKDTIKNTVTNGSASLSYELDDAEGAFFLTIGEGSTATLDNVNVDVTAAGSIGFGKGGATLVLTNGGSVTTGASANFVIGTLGATNNLYILTETAGSLIAGTNIMAGDKLLAGSYGTLGPFIHAGIPFLKSGTNTVFGHEQSAEGGGANSGAKAGSIVAFTETSPKVY